MFKNLFKPKKSTDYIPGTNVNLSPELKALVEKSPLKIMTHRLFMHYLSDNLVEEPGNPAWENQAVFFWDYDESFEKKSLPPEFKKYPEQFFISIREFPAGMSIKAGEMIPWFGMPGGGIKYFVEFQEAKVPIKELLDKEIFQKVEIITLTEKNSTVLQNVHEYFFLMDKKKIQFNSGKFFYNNAEIQFSDAYERGFFTIIRLLN